MINSDFGSMGREARGIKTDMTNLRISVGGEMVGGYMNKSDQNTSCTKQEPTSPDDNLSVTQLQTSLNSLTPVPSLNNLNIPALKFEDNGEVEIQSPDYSLWESIFSDSFENHDFMICSPVRNNMPSPQPSTYYNSNNISAILGGHAGVTGSPPRFSSPLGPNKGKGLSPLHRVFNSPNNQFTHVEQVENLSLPPLESLLDDPYYKDDDFMVFSPMKLANGGQSSSLDCYDALTMVPELLECLTEPNSTRFSGPALSDHASSTSTTHQNSQVSQESGIYQVGSSGPPAGGPAPLSQQLQQERQQEEQHQHLHRDRQKQIQTPGQPRIQQQLQQQNPMQNMHNTFMVPSIEPEQVQFS